MADSPKYTQLERRVQRIHQLLEAEGSVVTWNDRISDPDKPSRMRQIDVTIRRDGALTLVECRLHNRPQDVKWIEELIGRRISLQADAVIAVSDSGFTSTAIAKAEKHGVHLRDFQALSREEIQEWGKSRPITFHFCEFKDIQLSLFMPKTAPMPAGSHCLTDGSNQPISPHLYQLMLQQVTSLLGDQNWGGEPLTIDCEMTANLLADGIRPDKIKLTARVRRISRVISVASVVHYVDSATAAKQVAVGSYDLGASEVIEDCDRLAVTIDLSSLSIPNSCRLETFQFDAGRVVQANMRCIGVSLATLDFDGAFEINFLYPVAQ